MSSGLGIAFGVVLLLANAFFVGAEFAVISARRSQIEPRADAGSKAARTTLWAMENVSLMLACAQLGITVCSLGLLAITEPALHHILEGPLHALGLPDAAVATIAFLIAVLVVGYLHILAGEMIPKNISLAVPDRAALLLVPVLVGVSKVVKPIIIVLNAVANAALRLGRVTPKDEVSSVFTLEEVRSLVDASRREGLVSDEHGLLSGTLTFGDRTAGAVAVPLDHVTTVTAEATPADVERLVARTGYSRFPVTRGEQLLGYIHIHDVLDPDEPYDQAVPPARIRRVATIGAGEPIDAALTRMQHDRVHLLGVTNDDQHAIYGVIFFEDILEELVGEINDAMQTTAT